MQNNQDSKDKQEQIKAAYENRIDVEYIPPTVFQQSGEKCRERKRVAPYCRVSTSSEDQRASYETQIQAYKDYVSKHEDWVLVDIYADEGISGTSLKNRTNFKRMIDDCKAGKIDMIITKNISRFARNVVDCVLTARALKSLTPPVAIFFEDVRINTLTQTGGGFCSLSLRRLPKASRKQSPPVSNGDSRKDLKRASPRLPRSTVTIRTAGSYPSTLSRQQS